MCNEKTVRRYLPHFRLSGRCAQGERRGRPFPATLTMKILANTLGLLAGRKRREAMRRFAGYALLRPAVPGT